MKLKYFASLTAVFLAAAIPTFAATLKAGDPAPKLQVSKWVQGDPVNQLSTGTVYIVEFWATWCGPCRASIPHVNELQNKLKDKGLVVIGQNIWENDQAAVEPFVKKMGDKMTYRVALDTVPGSNPSEGKMATTWMKAAEQDGIPCSFVIDKTGTIAWIGHPMELNEAMIQKVIDGTFDVKKAAAEREDMLQKRQQIGAASQKMETALRAKDWTKADEAINELAKLIPASQKSNLDVVRLKILLGKGETDTANKLATQLGESEKENFELLNAVAWELTTATNQSRNLELAEKIATQANIAAKGKEPHVLDTLARVAFMRGNKAKAIEYQTEAIRLADERVKPFLQKTLESYQQDKLPPVED